MWCLKGQEDLYVYILPNQKQSFGKSLSDIKIEGDTTISRLHAIVSVEPDKESDTQYKCILTDLSKYGTFILENNEKRKLSCNEKYILKSGDKIQFGLKQSIFTVSYHLFETAGSNLNEEDTKKLKHILSNFGGRFSETWQASCTHLSVPNNVLFTTKLACALASAKPIVTTKYWRAVQRAIETSKILPNIEDFLPAVKEEWLHVSPNLFLPKAERQTLFKGLSFVHFCAKQYYAHVQLIVAAGGKSCVYPTRKPLTPKDLTAKNAIVIQQPANDSSQFTQIIAADYPVIYRKLDSLKRRMISDTEIPLAILYCSAEKYCNPRYDFRAFLTSASQTFCPSDVIIIEDTQEVVATSKHKVKANKREKQHIIPETCDSFNERNISSTGLSAENKKRQDISESSDSHKNIVNISFTTETKKQPTIIPETCESYEENVIYDNSATRKKLSTFGKSHYSQEKTVTNDTAIHEINKQRCNLKSTNSKNNDTINKQQDTNKVYTSCEKDNNSKNPKKRSQLFAIENENNITAKKRMLDETTTKSSLHFNDESENTDITLERLRITEPKKAQTVTLIETPGRTKRKYMEIDECQQENVQINEKYDDRARNVSAFHSDRSKNTDTNSFKKPCLATKKVKPNDNEVCVNLSNEKPLQKNDPKSEDWNNSLKCRSNSHRETSQRRHEKTSETHLDKEFTDKIFRNDTPCGKKFKKIPFVVPVKTLSVNDFISSSDVTS